MELTALLGLVFGSEIFGYITAFLAILGAASAVARVTPTKADDKVVNKICGFVHKIGLTSPDKKGGFINVGLTIVMCLIIVTALVCTGCAMVNLKPGSVIKMGDTTMRVNDNGDYCVNSEKVNQLVTNFPVMVDEGTTIITDVGTLTKTRDGLEYCMSKETANRLTSNAEYGTDLPEWE